MAWRDGIGAKSVRINTLLDEGSVGGEGLESGDGTVSFGTEEIVFVEDCWGRRERGGENAGEEEGEGCFSAGGGAGDGDCYGEERHLFGGENARLLVDLAGRDWEMWWVAQGAFSGMRYVAVDSGGVGKHVSVLLQPC